MANVYVDPRLKGSDLPIEDYVLEHENDVSVHNEIYSAAAVAEAKRLGHCPLTARVQRTSKGDPDHWGEAKGFTLVDRGFQTSVVSSWWGPWRYQLLSGRFPR